MPTITSSALTTDIIALAKDCHVYQPAESDSILTARNKEGILLGFIAWRVVLDEAELLSIAVAPKARRQGIANTLLSKLFPCIQGCSLYLEVRQSNQAAIACYEKNNFTVVGLRKNYYPTADGFESAILMKRICSS